jgi:transcriptional regulator with XRE-family HTH domain
MSVENVGAEFFAGDCAVGEAFYLHRIFCRHASPSLGHLAQELGVKPEIFGNTGKTTMLDCVSSNIHTADYIALRYTLVNSMATVASAIVLGYNEDMKSIDEIRLFNFLRLLQNTTQAEVARRMERSPGQIQQWAAKARGSSGKGARNIDDSSARLIESALGLAANWMDHEHISHTATLSVEGPVAAAIGGAAAGLLPNLSSPLAVAEWEDVKDLEDDMVIIPRYRMAFSAGSGTVIFEVQKTEKGDAFRSGWLRQKGCSAKDCFLASVEGDSMEPSLFCGDSVLVSRKQKEIIDRKVYAVCVDGKIFCKRLFKAADEIVMRSDNSAYPEIRISASLIEIIGRVLWRAGDL